MCNISMYIQHLLVASLSFLGKHACLGRSWQHGTPGSIQVISTERWPWLGDIPPYIWGYTTKKYFGWKKTSCTNLG